MNTIVNQKKLSLSDNWTITINGNVLYHGLLSDAFFPVTNTGDHMELSTILPDSSINRPALQFKTYHSIIHVFLNGENIYEYGTALHEKGKMVGSGIFTVSLPENYMGKELKICFDVTEDNAFSSIDEISIMKETDVTQNFIFNRIIELIIGIFLFSFGILLLCVVLFIGKKDKVYRTLFWIAIFSATVAIWMMSNFNILQLVCSNLNTISYFEYLSLYFAPIPMLLFVYDSQDNRKTKYAIQILVSILAAFIAIAIYLNEFTIYHLSKVLPLFHIIGLCTIALTTISIILSLKQQSKKSDLIIIQGLGVMLLFLFTDTLRFNIHKYLHPKNINIADSILPVGVLVFIFTMLASYIYRLVQVFHANAEKQVLVQLAYTDALTHIGNRAKCEEVFHEHDTTESTATIINFDLNHFKEVNDTFGHAIGDEVLVEFAKLLQNTYEKDGFIGRMGGDEFIVVLDSYDEDYVQKTIADLMSAIHTFNQTSGKPYQISVACGYCSNKGRTDCSLWKIYEESDKKMYHDKEAHR